MDSFIKSNKILKKGSFFIEKGDFEAALNHYNKAISYDPLHAWYGKGLVYVQMGDDKNALESFNKCLLDNDFVPALLERGKLLKRTGRPEYAQKSLDTALKLSPNNPVILYEKADLLLDLNEYDSALILFDKILSLAPNFFHAWHGKGDIFSITEFEEEALDAYSNSLNINSSFLPSWVGLGITYTELGQFEDALDCFTTALEFNPSFNFLYLCMSKIYQNLEDYDSAIYYIDTALAGNNKFNEAWYQKGVLLNLIGDLDGCLKCLDKISINRMEYTPVWWMKGIILKENELYSDSIECFQKAIELDEEFIPAWKSIEEVLYLTDIKKAESIHEFINNNFSNLEIKNADDYPISNYKYYFLNSQLKRMDLPELGETSLRDMKNDKLKVMNILDEERKKPFKADFDVRNRLFAYGALNLVFGFMSIITALAYGPYFFILTVLSIIMGYKIFTIGQLEYYDFNYHRKMFMVIGLFYLGSLIISGILMYSVFTNDPATFILKTMEMMPSRYDFTPSPYSSIELFYHFMLFAMIIGSIIMMITAEAIALHPNAVYKYPSGTEPVRYTGYYKF